jgi:hypothetical protein
VRGTGGKTYPKLVSTAATQRAVSNTACTQPELVGPLNNAALAKLPFKRVDKLRLLGLNFAAPEGRLNFEEHVAFALNAAVARLPFLRALRKLGAPWCILRSAAWGFILSRFFYAVSTWGFTLTPETWRLVDIRMLNHVTRIACYANQLVRVETTRFLTRIPGGFTRFNTEVCSMADLLLRVKNQVGPRAALNRVKVPALAEVNAVVFEGPPEQQLPNIKRSGGKDGGKEENKTSNDDEANKRSGGKDGGEEENKTGSADEANMRSGGTDGGKEENKTGNDDEAKPICVPHHILGASSYTSLARSVLTGASPLSKLALMPRDEDSLEQTMLLYPDSKARASLGDRLTVTRFCAACDATALQRPDGYYELYGMIGWWDRVKSARPQIFLRCIGQAPVKAVYEGERAILEEMLNMAAHCLRLETNSCGGPPPAFATPASPVLAPSPDNSPVLLLHDCLGCQDDDRIVRALNNLRGNAVLYHVHSHVGSDKTDLPSLEIATGAAPTTVIPHSYLDAVDVYLGKKAKLLHAQLAIGSPITADRLLLVGMSRKGLAAILRNIVWEEAITDPWLTGKKTVPASQSDNYPSRSLQVLKEDGISHDALRELMRGCSNSRSQALLLRVLSGLSFKTIVVDNETGKKRYETVQDDFRAAVLKDCGSKWWEELPAVCNTLVSRAAENTPPHGADNEGDEVD